MHICRGGGAGMLDVRLRGHGRGMRGTGTSGIADQMSCSPKTRAFNGSKQSKNLILFVRPSRRLIIALQCLNMAMSTPLHPHVTLKLTNKARKTNSRK